MPNAAALRREERPGVPEPDNEKARKGQKTETRVSP
jgi:hypothetical protein